MNTRKFFCSSFTLLFSVSANVFSQPITNPGFENWTNHTFYEDPAPFSTSNTLSYLANGVTVVSKSTDKHGGSYAALLTVDSLTSGNAGGTIFLGIPAGGLNFLGGIPYNKRPDSLVGYYKCDIAANDTAKILVGFKKSKNLIGGTEGLIRGTHSNYIRFSFPITFLIPFINPDTLVAGVLISAKKNAPLKNKIYLDDIGFIGSSVAPFPNGNFETWSSVTSEDPDGWATSNLYTFGKGVSVSKTTNKNSGSFAATITTQNTFYGGPPTCFLINGQLGESGPKGGQPVSMIPIALTGYYKATTLGGDLATATVHFSQWNSSTLKSDSLAEFVYHFTNSVNYNPFTFSIPDFTGTPDTLLIGFSSSDILNAQSPHTVGSTLTVDDLSFQFTNGLTMPLGEYFNDNVLYPNPSNGTVTLDYHLGNTSDVTVKVYDVNGRVIKTVALSNQQAGDHQFSLGVKDVPAGIYFYSFNTGEKESVKKFTIAR